MQFRIVMTLIKLLLLGSLTAASVIPINAGKDFYKALYDFASQGTGEVDLHRGEIVTVLQEDSSGWWLIEKPDGDAQGWAPGSYFSAVSSGPSPSLKMASLSSTTDIKSLSSQSSKSVSSTTKTNKFSSSMVIEGIASSRTSTSARPSNSSRPSLASSSSSSSSFPSSAKRSPSPSSTRVNPFMLPSPTSGSPSPALSSFSTVRTSSQVYNAAVGTIANNTSSPSTIAFVQSAPVTAPTNSSTIPFTTTSSTTSIAGPTNVGSAYMPGINATTGSFSNTSSLPMDTGTMSNSTTSMLTPTNSPNNCLLNCGSTNSSLVNAASQANTTNTSSAAVPSECADPGGVNGITSACWVALDMSHYINEWLLSHQGLCHAQTPFAQCFLQTLDTGMNDCVSISSGTCPPPSWIQFKDHNMSVRDFYAAYNIYAVWTFFNSYYLAIGNARSASTDSIAAIVSLLNPPKTNNAELSNINFALAIGLTFVKFEGFASPLTESLVGIVVNAARQAPQVARYLFPGPPGDTKFVQLGQISNQMGTLTDNLQKHVATALSVIQNDTSTFLSFTGTGAFSNNPVVKMNQQSDSLLTALNTYVISLCLQANNWQISRAIDTDVNKLMANGTKLTWNIPNCGTGYDPKSICGAYYWNSTIDVSYTLTNTDDMFQNPAPIMQQFFANWTTPQLLFDGALQCQMAQGTGNPNINPIAGTNDVTSTPCLSSVKICTWDLNPSHFGTQYEYTDCDVQDHFATQGCTQCDATTDFCTNVPSSYLGGYLLDPSEVGPQYVFCDDGHTTISTNN